MSFVRKAQLGDLVQLAGFDEWKQATAQTVDAGECFVAGHEQNLAMQGTLCKLGFRLSGVVDNLAELPELVYVKPLTN